MRRRRRRLPARCRGAGRRRPARARACSVVDLSADFRLRDPEEYREWYGELGAPELLPEAVYGLPELYREQIASASLVANPGCYPTATILALAPLAAAGLIADVVVDAKSGVSGAGRGGGDAYSFVTLDENASPYGTGGHRHEPEIGQELRGARRRATPPLNFVPHLVPLDQGELVSCYVTTARELEAEELARLYEERYADEPFVELVDGAAGRPRRPRHEHLPDPRDRRGRRPGAGLRRDRQPLEGRRLARPIQNLNLMLRAPRGRGDLMSDGDGDASSDSRWVELPEGVEELTPTRWRPGSPPARSPAG